MRNDYESEVEKLAREARQHIHRVQRVMLIVGCSFVAFSVASMAFIVIAMATMGLFHG